MSDEKCFYEYEGFSEKATHKLSFDRDAGILVGNAKTKETHLVCKEHKDKLVSDFRKLHRGLKVGAGKYKISKMRG